MIHMRKPFMPPRADAHIHLFEGGYHASLAGRPGVQIDEATLYGSLLEEHDIRLALVVGYAAEAWCRGNNAYLEQQVRRHAWVRPLAYLNPTALPDLSQLQAWASGGFVGVVFYLFNDEATQALHHLPDAFWRWITERGWLVSANSRGAHWLAWRTILDRHPELRLLVSHLGLPPRVAEPPSAELAATALESVIALSAYPGPQVKLSGFYALTDPGHDYPHRAAWPYVQQLLAAFGPQRLLWASDCTPCLDWVTLPQTYGLLGQMPFLSTDARQAIEGGNLLTLLTHIAG